MSQQSSLPKSSVHSFPALDGLRGVAALVVLFHHYTLAFFPANITHDPGIVYSKLDPYFRYSPLTLLIDGHFAVSIFFVLSGFVLSQKFFTGAVFSTWDSVIKRYFRLTVPVLASMVIAWLLLKFGVYANHQVSFLSSSTWFRDYYVFKPDLWTAIWQGLVGVYTTPVASYNTITWTIGIELVGSYIVYGCLSFFAISKRHWLVYIPLIALTYNTWYFGFTLGLLLANLWHSPLRDRLVRLMSSGIWIPMGIIALLMGYGTFSYELVPYFAIKGMNPDANMIVVHGLAAFTIVLIGLTASQVKWFFNLRPLQWLGKVSFSFYLLHLIILCSFAAQLFLLLRPHLSYTNDFRVTLVISLALTMAVSHLFYVYVDKWTTSHSRRFYQLATGAGSASLAQLSGLAGPRDGMIWGQLSNQLVRLRMPLKRAKSWLLAGESREL